MPSATCSASSAHRSNNYTITGGDTVANGLDFPALRPQAQHERATEATPTTS